MKLSNSWVYPQIGKCIIVNLNFKINLSSDDLYVAI